MQPTALSAYLANTNPSEIDTEFIAYIANLTAVQSVSPETALSIIKTILESTKPKLIATGENIGKQSRGNAFIDETIKQDFLKRIKNLLEAFPLYPALNFDFLLERFLVK